MAVVYTKSEKKNIIIRVVLLAILLVVIVVCAVIIVNQMKTKSGIQKISNDSAVHKGELSDFSLNYYLDEDNIARNQILLEREYANAFDKIYELITPYEDINYIHNIKYINEHINEEIKIDSILYDYLKLVYELNPYYILQTPNYNFWKDIIYISDTKQRELLDPINNIDSKNEIDYFINDSINYISLDFLNDNIIKLNVDPNYKTICEDNMYISFNSFYDAVIMDYIKKELNNNGHTDGYIASINGYYLDLGMTSKTNYIVLRSNEYKEGYYALQAKKNYSYITIFDFKVSTYYPYYEINDLKRTLFLNQNTGYSYDIKPSVYYDNMGIINTLDNLYKYFNNDIKTNYILLDDNKIKTNDESIKSDKYEVVYEK